MFALNFRTVAIVLSLVISCGSTAAAQETAVPVRTDVETAKKTETIKLAITPAAESKPLLKFRLAPRYVDLRQGNAAPLYAQAALHYKPTEAEEKRIGELLKASPGEFARLATEKDAESVVRESTIDLLRVASRRERCDWDLPLREQNPFSVLLPEQQEMRKLARLVALKARLCGAKLRYAEAVEMLTVGYRMAQHEGQTPVLITGLIGISIARMMDDVVLDLAQRPDAPNLYWALSTRPTPLIEFRSAFEAESDALDLALPVLREAVEKDPAAVNWDVQMLNVGSMLNLTAHMSGDDGDAFETNIMEQIGRKLLPTAAVFVNGKAMREYVASRGVPKARVDGMGNTQLMLAHDKLKFDEHRDRMFAWASLPYPQGRAGIEEAERRLKQSGKDGDALMPWGNLLLPAVVSVRWTHANQERTGDVLRIVEALRLHAAEHAGKLPKSLAELQGRTPLPLDCVTGEPFRFVVEGETATLTLPPNRAGREAVVYEITIAK
jgi:hypothetical protein